VMIESPIPLQPLASGKIGGELDRLLSLVDAYIVRNDLTKASDVLKQGEVSFGTHPEVIKRLKLVNQRHLDNTTDGLPALPNPEPIPLDTSSSLSSPTAVPPRAPAPLNRRRQALESKIALLQQLLKQVAARGESAQQR
jgi:hypothetical protein